MIAYVRHKTKKHYETCVLEVSKLDVHGSKLHAPSDLAVLRRWRFESHGVPICRLYIFKVGGDFIIIYLVLQELAFVCWYRITSKDPSNMFGKSLGDALVD